MSKIKKASNSPILLTIIGILLLAVVFLSYQVYTLMLNQNGSNNQSSTAIMNATNPLPQSDFSTVDGKTIFTNPELNYMVAVPKDWTTRSFKSLAGRAVQSYEDVIFLSPDYTESGTNSTDSLLQEGASIFIRGNDTIYKTIDERFKNNVVAQKVATNVKRGTVSGVPTVEYEYEITGENVTNITLIKDGIWYLLKFQYADSEAKVKYQGAFDEVVNSFTLN